MYKLYAWLYGTLQIQVELDVAKRRIRLTSCIYRYYRWLWKALYSYFMYMVLIMGEKASTTDQSDLYSGYVIITYCVYNSCYQAYGHGFRMNFGLKISD